MIDDVISSVRRCSPNLNHAVVRTVTADTIARNVDIDIITDKVFSDGDAAAAREALAPYVPSYFKFNVNLSKLSPDEGMVKRKLTEGIALYYKAVSAILSDKDIQVKKTDEGFDFTITVAHFMSVSPEMTATLCKYLAKNFCGEFTGGIAFGQKEAEDLVVEEKEDEIEFEVPVRTFKIEKFAFLEGVKKHERAVYLADLNFAADEVVICGAITDIRERTYTNKLGVEKVFYSFTLSDTTAAAYVTYFPRKKSLDKIKDLRVGDSIVCTGTNEEFKGNLRYTAKIIDYGCPPKNFVPEKRMSKPVPMFYHHVKPEPFVDAEQTDLLTQREIPDCLKQNSFVVFDLETTGLNSSPVAGNMDRIIEIGAYKIENGEISQSFSTFVNPQRKLSEEIIRLTGITEEMVADAPTYEEVMPDFYKFCSGSIAVGHNMAGFDYKFVEYYCASLGYIMDRKIIDTLSLSQELLILGNYKLNTIADKFHIKFNHHRATDDALATAKIFIELIKIKKSLPTFQ